MKKTYLILGAIAILFAGPSACGKGGAWGVDGHGQTGSGNASGAGATSGTAGSGGGGGTVGTGGSVGTGGAVGTGGTGAAPGSGSGGTGGSIGSDDCESPDMLIVLDRTMSMHRRPDGSAPADTAQGHEESKWHLAITALEAITDSFEQTIRFGLELFPKQPQPAQCVTLSERIGGTKATNPHCEGGEIAVMPGLSTAFQIATALDPETTRLCTSTPIGPGLNTASAQLQAIANPVRDQYALLLTDGNGTCGDDEALSEAQNMAAAGVKLYVIGFDGSDKGVDPAHLNDLACAGHTAPGFPAPCTDDGAGNYTATDPNGADLFLVAEDAAALTNVLTQVAGAICCEC